MIVMKFGGTSVGSGESIVKVRQIVGERLTSRPVVVVSALSGVTNMLIDLASADTNRAKSLIDQLMGRHTQVINELWPSGNQELTDYTNLTVGEMYENSLLLSSDAAKDLLLSIGETLSSRIVSEYFSIEFPATQVLSSECVVTNDQFGSAEVIDQPTKFALNQTIKSLVNDGTVPVITGFIGSTSTGQVTTLGRGGSDYSAALVGHYIEADEIQIWTDVDGAMSADPRAVSQARLIDFMTYEEAAELAAFGAKVLHPKTMRPAVYSNIPIRIANTFNPLAPTTLIQGQVDRASRVMAVAAKTSVEMVNIYAAEMLLQKGFLSRISAVFARHGISIDIVSATEVSVSITLDNDEKLKSAIEELESYSNVTVFSDVGLVSLIGKDIAFSPGLIAQVFNQLSQENIATRMVSVGAEGVNISLVVESSVVDQAVTSLHNLLIGGGVR